MGGAGGCRQGRGRGESSVKRLAKSCRTLKVVREGGPCKAQLVLDAVTHPSPCHF